MQLKKWNGTLNFKQKISNECIVLISTDRWRSLIVYFLAETRLSSSCDWKTDSFSHQYHTSRVKKGLPLFLRATITTELKEFVFFFVPWPFKLSFRRVDRPIAYLIWRNRFLSSFVYWPTMGKTQIFVDSMPTQMNLRIWPTGVLFI